MDSEITGVEFEQEIAPGSSVDLDADWVAWLEGEPVPDCVEGVDPTITHGASGSAIA
ncbi:hypothetical protein [Alloactinosynnema sp. L-07]|uniref:hypothetical protein n=1 Tax=Alloactinosynnema sp. L-07 TaxID=1653480 RepID=UPI00065F030D|nr:hypothetical protein [Alloactinosynnema sp. L-07]CRK55591.1 hypothetical protein [Alloactinosynnema sp. L-07]